uniref:Solute carrier family 2 member 9, like 1 n=1 Tax=Amphilophus citrinellus TaxID=61819 RepID=A0A3Q0RLI2_AMPCI
IKTHGNGLLLILILGFGGSFQHGYQITGLSSPSPRFINSSWYDRYKEPPPPQTVTMIWSLIVSMYAVGGLFGAGSVKFISAAIMLTSKSVGSFEMSIVARIIYGYSAGLGLNTHLMYLGEISLRKIRGTVTLTSTIFTALGKLSGQLLGLSELLGREDTWEILLCVPAVFSVVQIVVLPFFPEAPRYLFIEKRDDKACKKALQSLWGQGDYTQEMDEMLTEQAAIEAAPQVSPLQLLRDRTVRWQLITMSTIYCCNHLTFSFDIFLEVGIPKKKIRYITLGLGVAEILTSVACFITLVTIRENMDTVPLKSLGTFTHSYEQMDGSPIVSLILTGGVTGTINSEVFIQSNRVAALVLMGLLRWFMFAVLGLVFPFLINALSSYCFLLYACACVLGSLYMYFFLPETKGKTLLEISEEFKAITVCGKSFAEEKRTETKL